MAKKKKAKAKTTAQAKAKVARARLLKVAQLAEDRHLVTVEKEVHGPIPELPAEFSESTPIELTPDAPEPVKRSLWQWLIGE